MCVCEVVASIVTAVCGEEEDKRSLPLCILVVVLLSHSVFCSLWTTVVFLTFGFSTLISVSSLSLLFFLFSVYNPTVRLWLSKENE